jgi:hypothetical protein
LPVERRERQLVAQPRIGEAEHSSEQDPDRAELPRTNVQVACDDLRPGTRRLEQCKPARAERAVLARKESSPLAGAEGCRRAPMNSG